MLIAIDHGNYAIKTPHTAFLSGLSEHKVKPPLAEEAVEYGGSYWTRPGTAGSLSSPCSLLAVSWSAGALCFPLSKLTWLWACLPSTMACSGTSLPSTSAGVW